MVAASGITVSEEDSGGNMHKRLLNPTRQLRRQPTSGALTKLPGGARSRRRRAMRGRRLQQRHCGSGSARRRPLPTCGARRRHYIGTSGSLPTCCPTCWWCGNSRRWGTHLTSQSLTFRLLLVNFSSVKRHDCVIIELVQLRRVTAHLPGAHSNHLFAMQTYGGILGLAPFPLWRLEAAVAPGPTQLPAAQPAAPPDARRQGKAAADAVDPIIRTRRKRDAEEVIPRPL